MWGGCPDVGPDVLIRLNRDQAGEDTSPASSTVFWKGTIMKKMISLLCTALALVLGATGCSSLRVTDGSLNPPEWVTDYAAASNYNPAAYVYASGISTYSVVLEDGINDARHDAIRKIVEQIGVAADDTYRTGRDDKRKMIQTGMPNIPQAIMNSGKSVDVTQAVEARKNQTPQATHVSQTRIHGIEASQLAYSIWRYRPGLWSRLFGNDNAVRYYDVYVLIRCPLAEFENAVKTEKR
jgi:hypothetical protein